MRPTLPRRPRRQRRSPEAGRPFYEVSDAVRGLVNSQTGIRTAHRCPPAGCEQT
jgi:hypothetical protein